MLMNSSLVSTSLHKRTPHASATPLVGTLEVSRSPPLHFLQWWTDLGEDPIRRWSFVPSRSRGPRQVCHSIHGVDPGRKSGGTRRWRSKPVASGCHQSDPSAAETKTEDQPLKLDVFLGPSAPNCYVPKMNAPPPASAL